jgi:hypothetical protein
MCLYMYMYIIIVHHTVCLYCQVHVCSVQYNCVYCNTHLHCHMRIPRIVQVMSYVHAHMCAKYQIQPNHTCVNSVLYIHTITNTFKMHVPLVITATATTVHDIGCWYCMWYSAILLSNTNSDKSSTNKSNAK